MFSRPSRCIRTQHKCRAGPKFRLCKRSLGLWAAGLLSGVTEEHKPVMWCEQARPCKLWSHHYDVAEPWLHPYVTTSALSVSKMQTGVKPGGCSLGHGRMLAYRSGLRCDLGIPGWGSTSPFKLTLLLSTISWFVFNSQLQLVAMQFFRGQPVRNRSWISYFSVE